MLRLSLDRLTLASLPVRNTFFNEEIENDPRLKRIIILLIDEMIRDIMD